MHDNKQSKSNDYNQEESHTTTMIVRLFASCLRLGKDCVMPRHQNDEQESTAKEQQRTKKESDNQVRAMAKQNEQQAKELSLVQLLSMIDGDDPHNQVIIYCENLNTRMVCS